MTLSPGHYYNASQLRADTWQRLKHDSMRLADHVSSGREIQQLREGVRASLETLEPIETYWAFPGPFHFRQLHEFFVDEEYAELAHEVGRLVRAMVSGSYRRRRLDQDQESHFDDAEDHETSDDFASDPQAGRPYFEVMVVDHMSQQAKQSLRHGLHRMRRSEDAFLYETVIVPSLEDAVIAALLNPIIQAVVIRYDFPAISGSRKALIPRVA